MNAILTFIFILNIILLNVINCSSDENIFVKTNQENRSPQIAILCENKETQISIGYFNLTVNEWRLRNETKCTEKLEDILNLCKTIYPNLIIKNVMQKHKKIDFNLYKKIENNKKILIKKSIKPYACLYGSFIANALYVPLNCEYKNFYNSNSCEKQEYWNVYANEKCVSTNRTLNSTSLLRWCDCNKNKDNIGKFNGVEFVCCSIGNKKAIATNPEVDDDFYNSNLLNGDKNEDIIDQKIDYDNNADETLNNGVIQPNGPEKIDELQYEDEDLIAIDGDIEEKTRYLNELKKINESFNTLNYNKLQNWRDMRTKYKNDPKKLNEIDSDFNNQLLKLEQDKDTLIIQNEVLHADIVQTQINNEINKARINLNQFKLAPNLLGNIEMYLNLIKNYVKAHEHDRLHQITLFKRLYTNDESVNQRKTKIIDHLKQINRTLEEKLNELKLSNIFKNKIDFALKKFTNRYELLRQDAENIISQYKISAASNNVDNIQVNSDNNDFNGQEFDANIDSNVDEDYLVNVNGNNNKEDENKNTNTNNIDSNQNNKNQLNKNENEDDDLDIDLEDDDIEDESDDEDFETVNNSIDTQQNQQIQQQQPLPPSDNDLNTAQNNEEYVYDNDGDNDSNESNESDIDDDDDGNDGDDDDEYSNEIPNDIPEIVLDSSITDIQDPQVDFDGSNQFDSVNNKQTINQFTTTSRVLLIYIVIGVCVLVILILLVMGILLHRRLANNPNMNGFYCNTTKYKPLNNQNAYNSPVPINNDVLTREERYVNQMQSHGFVNPMHAIAENEHA